MHVQNKRNLTVSSAPEAAYCKGGPYVVVVDQPF